MIADLKPYAAYKESGVSWLGRVPTHWSVRRIKTVLREADCRSSDGSGTLLSLTRLRGLIPHSNMTEKLPSARTLAGYKRYHAGQIVMNRMQAWSGMFGAGRVDGLVSPDYAVFDVLSGHETAFVLARLKSPDLVGRFALESKGIGSGFNRLYTDRFGSILISLPPLVEQAAIVRFLTWVNGRLERAILAKRKVIALLNEQKQVIIHRAVTRGLDQSVALRPTGVPWLGDIPHHWRIVRNMALFAHRIEAGVVGFSVFQVSLRSGITPEDVDHLGRPKRLISDPTKYKRVYEGDIAYNTMRMWQGAVGVSPSDGLVSPAYVVLSPRAGTYPDFYDLVFHTDIYKQQVNRHSTGIVSDRNRLYWDSFKQMPNIALPYSEQKAIVAFVQRETRGINAAKFRLEREVGLLREYRTRLITDVVTGKIDVREAAARLSDESPTDILEDDTDLIDETDPADEEALV